jgi:hypothetical protein
VQVYPRAASLDETASDRRRGWPRGYC